MFLSKKIVSDDDAQKMDCDICIKYSIDIYYPNLLKSKTQCINFKKTTTKKYFNTHT